MGYMLATKATATHYMVIRTRQSWGGERRMNMGIFTLVKALDRANRLHRDGYGYIIRPVKAHS